MKRQEIFAGSPSARYFMDSSRDLYLDTGFIRARGRSLASWPYLRRSRTGALTFIELLGEITSSEKEFRIRRSAIATIMENKIAVDWQIPNRKIPSAFTTIRRKYDIFDDTVLYLQKVATAAISAKSLQEFSQRIAGTPLQDALDHFAELDRSLGRIHQEGLASLIAATRAHYENRSKAMLLKDLNLPESATYEAMCGAMVKSGLARQLLIYAYMELYSEEQGITERSAQDELFNSYDGSIDAYVRGSAAQLWHNLSRKKKAGRNDGVDEYHLLYVVPGVSLITTDRGFAEWASASTVPVRFESAGG